jgi:hypothetical protein
MPVSYIYLFFYIFVALKKKKKGAVWYKDEQLGTEP